MIAVIAVIIINNNIVLIIAIVVIFIIVSSIIIRILILIISFIFIFNSSIITTASAFNFRSLAISIVYFILFLQGLLNSLVISGVIRKATPFKTYLLGPLILQAGVQVQS